MDDSLSPPLQIAGVRGNCAPLAAPIQAERRLMLFTPAFTATKAGGPSRDRWASAAPRVRG
jgi:hypothetical protein